MAVRPLVNIERLTTAHVNSVDGSMTYESGVEYKANTTVSYNGSLYTANVDIEDTDTDTPDEAPDRWSLTINASEVGTSGDISALAARVTALEETVGDDTDGLVKDVDDLTTEVQKRLTYTSLASSNYQLFDVLGDDTNYPPGTLYYCYASNLEVGTDKLHTLLSFSQYAHVEIDKVGTYLTSIKVFSPGGGCAFAYASPSDNSFDFGVFTPSGNSSVTITKPV